MTKNTIIKTERLVLRQWQKEDLEPFATMNADPKVREFFPDLMSSKESERSIKLMSDHIARCGWGFWAVSLIENNEFIGFIGLEDVYFQAHFTPAVEIGWRLAYEYWGKGYATEGAKAALKYGFETLRLSQVVSFTTLGNMRSRHVMKKIGMHHSAQDDFDHPKLPVGHPLGKHVLYRITSHDWFSLTHKDQKYVYKPYSPLFPQIFEKEKERISSSLANALAIEHVGSTAIPNLGGKGIIDIAISVPKNEMEHASKILQKLGYQYRPTFSTTERFYFVAYLADLEEETRRYHIHLTYPSSKEWNELIGFRNYLRIHPEAVEEYASLKKNAANEANHDGKQYRKIKEPMFHKINSLIQEHGYTEKVKADKARAGFVKIKDGSLYYHEIGQGIPIIVVHGGPGLDHGYLEPQLSQLAANHKLIFYDQRGSGKSLETPLDKEHINIHQFVEDIKDLRNSLGLNKFVLMGHSWGGLLAMQYAVLYQDELMGLILLDSAPADYKGQKAFTDEFEIRTKNIQNDIKPLFEYEEFKKLDAIQISDLYRKLFSVYVYNPEDVKDLSLNFSVESGQSGFKVMEVMSKTSWLQPNINLLPKLKTLMVPTLILHGKQDIIPTWTAQEIKDAIPQSKIVVLDHCNHFTYIEQPTQFFDELNFFLEKLQAQVSDGK